MLALCTPVVAKLLEENKELHKDVDKVVKLNMEQEEYIKKWGVHKFIARIKALQAQIDDDKDGCIEDCSYCIALQQEIDALQAEAKLGNIPYKEAITLKKENKALRDRLDDWIYELAYYTEDEVATPKGVKKFVGKALEDKTKEIDDLRE